MAMTPIIEVSWVAISEPMTTTVTVLPKCWRNTCKIVSPERIVTRLMPTTMTWVNSEAGINVHSSDMP